MTIAIRIENVSKLYRLGTVGTGTIAHDLNRWWHRVRGKDDPYEKVGRINDRTQKSSGVSRQSSAVAEVAVADDRRLTTADSRASGPEYVWALKDINLDVRQGEILGIIGRNGAGKSTLLKLLSRVTAPTTGIIKTKGRIASLLEVGTGFHQELTGRENIYLNGTILGMRRQEITKHLEEIVEFSGCARYLDTPVKRYSSGMTVRLGFAVAAHLDCEILIVDEVLAVGDMAFQSKCTAKLGEVSGDGRTVLFVSHNMAVARKLCMRGVLLDQGTVAQSGPMDEIVAAYMREDDIQRSIGSAGYVEFHDGNAHRPIRLTSLTVRNAEGSVCREFGTGDYMALELAFDAHERIVAPGFMVSFRNELGTELFKVSTQPISGFTIDSVFGTGVVRLEIPRIPLCSGKMFVDVGVARAGVNSFHRVEQACSILIHPADFYQSGFMTERNRCGVMVIDHRWSLVSGSEASAQRTTDV